MHAGPCRVFLPARYNRWVAYQLGIESEVLIQRLADKDVEILKLRNALEEAGKQLHEAADDIFEWGLRLSSEELLRSRVGTFSFQCSCGEKHQFRYSESKKGFRLAVKPS